MASNIFPDAQVVINKCDICNQGVDARFYCQECAQEMCQSCKTTHLRMNISRNHTVICIVKDNGLSVHDMETCFIHLNEPIQMYCLTCDVPVCHICTDDKTHNNHDFDRFMINSDEYKNYLSQFETKQEILGITTPMRSKQNGSKQDISQFETKRGISEIATSPRSKQNGSKQDISQFETKRRISETATSPRLQQNGSKDVNMWTDKTEIDFTTDRKEMKDYKNEITDASIKDVIPRKLDDVKSIDPRLIRVKSDINRPLVPLKEDILSSDSDTFLTLKSIASDHDNRLDDGKMSKSALPKQLTFTDVGEQGRFNSYDYEKEKTNNFDLQNKEKKKTDKEQKDQINCIHNVSNIKIRTEAISCINPGIISLSVSAINEKEAWCGDGRNVALIHVDGKIRRKVKLDARLYDLTVTSSGDLLITEFESHYVKKFLTDGSFTTVFNAKPYKTRGLCTTKEQDLLLCLYRNKNDNKVLRLSENGRIIQTIQYHRQNRPLFCDPTLVSENVNGDICVVDKSNVMIVISKYGQTRFIYPDSSSNVIDGCNGITCDTFGFILISDYNNKRIHQIDSGGKFVQYILTEQHGIRYPWGLSVDANGQLWVCNDCGYEVKVYKYGY